MLIQNNTVDFLIFTSRNSLASVYCGWKLSIDYTLVFSSANTKARAYRLFCARSNKTSSIRLLECKNVGMLPARAASLTPIYIKCGFHPPMITYTRWSRKTMFTIVSFIFCVQQKQQKLGKLCTELRAVAK